MQLVNAKSTSMLTKIIALSDVYGLTFDIDQAELISDQRLIANIFKLIKKTQMILPSTGARSPRRRSLVNNLSTLVKNRRSKSPNKEKKNENTDDSEQPSSEKEKVKEKIERSKEHIEDRRRS